MNLSYFSKTKFELKKLLMLGRLALYARAIPTRLVAIIKIKAGKITLLSKLGM